MTYKRPIRCGMLLLLVAVAVSCGFRNDYEGEANKKKEPPPFNPAVAVVCRATDDSREKDEALLAQIKAAVEELIREKQRVTLVDDPAKARLLVDITYFLKTGSINAGAIHRLQFIDTEHDVVVFEDCRQVSTGFDDAEELGEDIKREYEPLMERLEKPYSVASQVELGEGGVAYLETSPWKDDFVTYGRHDLGRPAVGVYLDYSVKDCGYGFAGTATVITANEIYKIVQRQKFEVVPSPDKADFVIRIIGRAGSYRSYSKVFGGQPAPVATDSSAALAVSIVVDPQDEAREPLRVEVQGAAPPAGNLTKNPAVLSIDNFKSALGRELGKVSLFLKS